MTVKHLQAMQRNQLTVAAQADPTIIHKFKAGFADCTDEVNRYINQLDGVDLGVKQRLIGHLNNCVTDMQQVVSPCSQYTNTYRNNIPFTNGNSISHQQNVLPLPHDGRIQMGGVQLIPSRLPTGELALVMPNSSNLPYFPTFSAGQNTLDLSSTCSISRVSAFNKPKTHAKHLSTDSSPPISPASSMSSGDEFLAQSEYQSFTTTPPLQQQNMLSAFPTPPSGGSFTVVPVKPLSATATISTLQQPQVTSTTEPPASCNTNTNLKVRPLSVITNTATNTPTIQRPEIQYVNKKRPYPIDMTADNGLLKMFKSEPLEKSSKLSESLAENNDDRLNNNININNDDNNSGDMWRPWDE